MNTQFTLMNATQNRSTVEHNKFIFQTMVYSAEPALLWNW